MQALIEWYYKLSFPVSFSLDLMLQVHRSQCGYELFTILCNGGDLFIHQVKANIAITNLLSLSISGSLEQETGLFQPITKNAINETRFQAT